ncbi:class I SAM-dependent methyltransferase [Sphingomonas sp. PWP1-2]|uniref:class I SAM-dependent methyltransferase n=1 Tax=Sphingomonas sp. PWP1-2 TaxID=2804558 RepID=UPI003CF5A776
MSYREIDDFSEKDTVVEYMKDCLGESFETLSQRNGLEIGGSGGILAGLLSAHLKSLISTDIADIAVTYDGKYPHLLREKFKRNGRDLDLAKLQFLWADAQNLPFRDNWFDFVVSLNAFEHIPDPAAALSEIMRVTAPNGLIYIRFDPVWTADSGSHFLDRIGAPWQHLISDDAEIGTMMAANGASDYEIASYKSHMNRLPVGFYRDMLPRVIERGRGTILWYNSYGGCVDEIYPSHPNLASAAAKLACDPADLLLRGFELVIKRDAD